MSANVLVVGGAGYIGAHTCKALASCGFCPVTLDNLSTGHRDFVRWGPLVRTDLTDSRAVEELIKRFDISAVLHFAAHAYVGESVQEPEKYYANNVAGTISLLRAMRASGCDQLVFSSSCAVYGEPREIPIGESTRAQPINPYGASKLMVERILEDYKRAYSFRFFSLRYFNACGADPEGSLGELRDPETHLIPRAIMAVQGLVNDLVVFGTDFETPDGTAVRDYTHVSDLADAHITALRHLEDGHPGGTFNLGTGQGHSVQEILREIESVTGQKVPFVRGPRRTGDPAVLIADPTRARVELGFSPRHSDLRTIIGSAWNWHLAARSKQHLSAFA